MSIYQTSYRLLFLLLVFLQPGDGSYAQQVSFPIEESLEKPNVKNNQLMPAVEDMLFALKDKNSSEAIAILHELEKRGASSGNYFMCRFYVSKAMWLWNINRVKAKDSVIQLLKKALNIAYETDDDAFISDVSWQCGGLMYGCGEIENAVISCLYAAELDEQNGISTNEKFYGLLGSILYRTRDYEKAMYYTRKAIEKETDTAVSWNSIIISRWNTIALCWQKMGNYDSAFFYFGVAMKIAEAFNINIWKGIIGGNIGQIYYWQKKYALAKPLLEHDYSESKGYGELASAANSLQWVARINLIEGEKDSALMQVKEAIQLLQQMPDLGYLQNVYYATAEVYRAFNNNDSAYRYSQLYNHLHDSTERAVATSRLEIAQVKLDNLQSVSIIKNLQKEKTATTQQRNFIIAVIAMFTIIFILILNRQRQKIKYEQQLTLQQKAAIASEVAAAKEQLQMFTQNLVEKTNLIEKLEERVKHKELSFEQQQLIEDLTHQTILTEEDWDKFKTLFEKIYPGFFIKLKEKVTDISIAEQRMAVLTKLHLNVRQMASILGISPDSVRRTKLRLRHRLRLDTDINIETFLAEI